MIALALAFATAQSVVTLPIPESGRLRIPTEGVVRLAFPEDLELADLRSQGDLVPVLVEAQPLVMELTGGTPGASGAIVVVNVTGAELRVEYLVVDNDHPPVFESLRKPEPTPEPTPQPTPTPEPTPKEWCHGIDAAGFALAKLERRGVTTSLPGQRTLELEHTARSDERLWYRFRLRGGAKDEVTKVSWTDGRAIHACVSNAVDGDLRLLVETAVQEDQGADLVIELAHAGRYKPRLSKGLLRRMRDVVF